MTLIEIAQEARQGELFKHDADDAELYFDSNGELMASDNNHGDFPFTLKREEILSNKWHFVW